MSNTDVRTYAKQKGVFLYSIAEKIGISEGTFIRKLRKELTEQKKAEIREIVDKLSAEKLSN